MWPRRHLTSTPLRYSFTMVDRVSRTTASTLANPSANSAAVRHPRHRTSIGSPRQFLASTPVVLKVCPFEHFATKKTCPSPDSSRSSVAVSSTPCAVATDFRSVKLSATQLAARHFLHNGSLGSSPKGLGTDTTSNALTLNSWPAPHLTSVQPTRLRSSSSVHPCRRH